MNEIDETLKVEIKKTLKEEFNFLTSTINCSDMFLYYVIRREFDKCNKLIEENGVKICNKHVYKDIVDGKIKLDKQQLNMMFHNKIMFCEIKYPFLHEAGNTFWTLETQFNDKNAGNYDKLFKFILENLNVEEFIGNARFLSYVKHIKDENLLRICIKNLKSFEKYLLFDINIDEERMKIYINSNLNLNFIDKNLDLDVFQYHCLFGKTEIVNILSNHCKFRINRINRNYIHTSFQNMIEKEKIEYLFNNIENFHDFVKINYKILLRHSEDECFDYVLSVIDF